MRNVRHRGCVWIPDFDALSGRFLSHFVPDPRVNERRRLRKQREIAAPTLPFDLAVPIPPAEPPEWPDFDFLMPSPSDTAGDDFPFPI
jgi:hypothetical protein